MSILKIKNRVIGNGQPPLIIAEIGINHNGSLNKAIQMIDDAYDAGCECVKFQFHIPDKEMIPNKVIPGNTSKSIWDVIKKATLTEKEENIIKNYVNKKKMIYLSTPFSKEAAYKLNKMKVDWFKIGSGECNNYPLIEYISRLKKPIILSTGMNNIQSIKKSVQIFEKYHLTYALLHCTSIYPCPSKNINLISIKDLKKNFPKAIIGFSDHSIDNYASFASVAMGSSIIERHFTSNKNWPGPDNSMSLTKNQLKDLVIGSKKIFISMGHGKKILAEEKKTIDFAYASLVSIKNINKGDKFTKNNIWVKRPGLGDYKAKDLVKVLGKKSKKFIEKDTYILKKHLM